MSHIVSDFDCFRETSVVAAPTIKAPSESVIAPPLVDLSGLNYLYHKVLQFKTSSAYELLMMAGRVYSKNVVNVRGNCACA